MDFALIGGFALNVFGYSRATQDIDLMIFIKDSQKVKKIMLSCGYDVAHESEDVSSFKGKMKELGSVDFIHAHRKYSVNMLKRAKLTKILNDKYEVKTISPEDLIGLKVQSSSNDLSRKNQDMADIEVILGNKDRELDMVVIKEYFDLFDRGGELSEMLERIKDA